MMATCTVVQRAACIASKYPEADGALTDRTRISEHRLRGSQPDPLQSRCGKHVGSKDCSRGT